MAGKVAFFHDECVVDVGDGNILAVGEEHVLLVASLGATLRV